MRTGTPTDSPNYKKKVDKKKAKEEKPEPTPDKNKET